jgi:spermidine synthase
VARLYLAGATQGFTGLMLRGLVCAACLLLPTLLMGATLPAMARWIDATPQGVSRLGFLYGGNTAGAVIGCLLAGFYLLRVHDIAMATALAALLNGAVALAAFDLAVLTRKDSPPPESAIRNPGCAGGFAEASPQSAMTPCHSLTAQKSWPVYVTIALSGMCALGAEVIWTRLLSLLLGGTVYTFSIILAVFLAGLGIGSGIGSMLTRGTIRPRVALGVCQLLLTAAIAWTAYMLACSIPYWPINPALSRSPWFTFQIDLVRCAWAILPATILWGASFPLALAAVSSGHSDPARLVGKVYAANTLGAIFGALGASLALVAWIGTQHAQQLLMVLSSVSALFVLISEKSVIAPGRPAPAAPGSAKENALALGLVLALGLAGLLAWNVPKVPWGLIAYGRYFITRDGESDLLYVGEGMNSSVAVTELGTGVRCFHVSGKVEASTDPQDMRLQRMLGHIPALLHSRPRSVLIVGCGAGVTAGSFLKYPGIEKIVICEIEPLIPQVVAQYFGTENHNVLKDPRVRIVYDDARHYVFTTPEKFDIITSDPIHPWVKGAATLYTREYFEMCRRHLNPGGLVTQWVPLYESSLKAVKSEVATFFAAFPDGTLWGNDEGGDGYDLVMLGQAEAMTINLEAVQRQWEQNPGAAESLEQVGIKSATSLLSTYGGRASDLGPWLKGAEMNRDRNLRLQYLAGISANYSQERAIYDGIVAHRRFPEKLFTGSEERRNELRKAIDGSHSGK